MSDQPARVAALDIRRSLLLQAPAGSGKTTVLAQRFLAALAEADAPEAVLAITFTRKAAAEMRERVLAALEGSNPPDHPEAPTWQALREGVRAQAMRRGWSQPELPQRLRIQTIDSLAHEIARAMPLLGRMQAGLQVIDDASLLHAEAARETLRHAEATREHRADADLLLRRLDNNWDQAATLLAGLLASRNRWQPLLLASSPAELVSQVAASLARIAGEVIGAARVAMPVALQAEAAQIASLNAGHRAAAAHAPGSWCVWLQPGAALGESAAALECWQAVAALALKEDGEPRQKVDARHGFPREDRALKQRWRAWLDAVEASPALLASLRQLLALPPPTLDAEEGEALAALARIMLLAAMHLKLVFRDHGLVDHAEIAAIARQALADERFPLHPALRVSHLLVDEFQDTSPEQLELVQALILAEASGEGERSLFLVGDPMQSIYMFRDSEVGLFLQTRAQGLPPLALEALHLQRNFRSLPGLVRWANSLFARIFPQQEDVRSSAVTFLPAEAARADGDGTDPEVHLWPQASDDPAVEAAAIAARIGQLRAQRPAVRVAVLVQTRRLAAPVLRALREAAIPVVGVDLAALSDRAMVRDLVALGRALLDAGDRTAWLAVLRAPPCGLLLADLQRLAALAGADPLVLRLADPVVLQALSADGRERLQRVGPVLVRAWRARGSHDVATAIERTWQALGGEQACSDLAECQAGRQYLLALYRLQEQHGRVSAAQLAELAARLRDRGEAVGESPVEVLTIHHAKGLEWDVVFVPGLGRAARSDSPPLLRWLQLPARAGATDLLLAVRSMGEPHASDPLSRYIARLQSQRQENERLRLLYVAVTRAREQLYLSGHAPPDKDGEARPPSRSLLAMMWPQVADAFAAPGDAPPAAAPAVAGEALRMNWSRLPAQWSPPAPPEFPEPLGLLRAQSERDSREPLEFSWVGPVARAAGTAMHAELERLALQGEAAIAGLPGREAACAAVLMEQGMEARQAAESARAIIRRLGSLVREEPARWLLFGPHREAASELRLSGMVRGELRNVVIDRSFIDADGTRWIIDYKTGVHAGGGLEEFIASELQRYAPQLRLYAELAGRLGGEPVRTALYFPWLGILREASSATAG